MGICGRISFSERPPATIDRTIAALSTGKAGRFRQAAGIAARLAGCDDGAVASNDVGDVAAFDGRIDNRADLQGALSCGDLSGRDNAEIALLGYRKWGDDFCNRIIGDYACAVWDGQARRLVMAADPGALRALYYWFGVDEVLFASEPRGLWSDPDIPKILDEDQVGAWLCLLPQEPQRSFFRDIFRVPPGHRVTRERGTTRVERWWQPEHVPELRLASDGDYEEALRSCLEEAVRCRVGSKELVGAALSGGLDSSAVTATAARLLATQGRRLTAFTATPTHPIADEHGRFVDEWPHAAALVAMYPNIDHVRIANDAMPVLDALELQEAGQDCPTLNPFNATWGGAIGRAARDRRITVTLSALMGNMTISYDGGELLTSQIRRANIIGAARTVRDLRRHGGRSRLGLLGEAADSILPPMARRALRRAVRTPEPSLPDFSIVDPGFVRSKGLETRARKIAGNLRNIARGNSRALRLALLNRSDQRSLTAAGTRRLFGIDPRDPTSDRRLIELCLSIPDNQYLRKGVYRSLIRRAMAGIVPDQILRESRRGLQSADWRFAFDAAVPKLRSEIERLRASPLARQCLDLARMESLLNCWPGPNDPDSASKEDYVLAFGRGVAAGRFIRRIEGGNR